MKKTNKPPSYYETIRLKRIYRKGFIERVKMAREASGKTTRQLADALGIPHKRYLSYEKQSEMRPWLLTTFCDATGADVGWLVSEHRPRIRLAEDMHIVEMLKEHYGADSPECTKAKFRLAQTKRAIEAERRRHH